MSIGPASMGPRYEPYLDTPSDEFRWRLGLRPLDLSDWLQYDDHASTELDHKRRLLEQHPDTVFRVESGGDVTEACTEVRDAIAEVVPDQFRVEDDSLHPLDAAGRMVQEDLVVMVERCGRLVCVGGSVCFPNRWDLNSKIGLTMAEVHQPVPDLNAQLDTAIDRSLARLSPDKAFWRLGWTVTDTDDLYQPTDGTAEPVGAVEDAGDFWLRVERETLRRFPMTGAVLFTIRTYLSPLRDVPFESRARLAAALDSMSPEILSYKALGEAGHRVAQWLREHPATPTAAT